MWEKKTNQKITLEDHRDFIVWRETPNNKVEIVDIVVGSERRKGRGRCLIKKVVESAPPGTMLIYVITRESNRIAQQFYINSGFKTISILRRFYIEDQEDGVMYGLVVIPKGVEA